MTVRTDDENDATALSDDVLPMLRIAQTPQDPEDPALTDGPRPNTAAEDADFDDDFDDDWDFADDDNDFEADTEESSHA